MLGKLALGKYRVLRPLGAGANAEVFLAEPVREPGRRVVVKRVRPQIAAHPTFRRMFAAEVRSAGGFSHPYAVGLLDAAADDPLGPCLVLEYVPGVTLEALLARSGRLDPARSGRLLGCLCHALQAAHDHGIIHRDLKPANLMVTAPGTPAEAVKVMDFGFAGFSARPHLQLADLKADADVYAIGTPEYVSPEMLRGHTVDSRSDLYSVGVIAYELFAGRLPFNSLDQDRLLAAHLGESPPRFAAVGCRDLPPGVEELVRLALAKYPNERPQTARQFADALAQATAEPDLWAATAPPGWDEAEPPLAMDDDGAEADAPADPFLVAGGFEVCAGERLAAAKLRGFVEDCRGEVVASEPGVILMRFGVPAGPPGDGSRSRILGWLSTGRKPAVARGQEPIEVELQMEKPDPTLARLKVTALCRPVAQYPPADLRGWQERCDKLHVLLRQYLGG